MAITALKPSSHELETWSTFFRRSRHNFRAPMDGHYNTILFFYRENFLLKNRIRITTATKWHWDGTEEKECLRGSKSPQPPKRFDSGALNPTLAKANALFIACLFLPARCASRWLISDDVQLASQKERCCVRRGSESDGRNEVLKLRRWVWRLGFFLFTHFPITVVPNLVSQCFRSVLISAFRSYNTEE